MVLPVLPNEVNVIAGRLPQCGWLDQMSAQPAGHGRDFQLLLGLIR